MKVVNTHQAKTHLSKLLDQAAKGEEIVIARAGKPLARLIAYIEGEQTRSGGQWKGLVRIGADFDDPLPDAIGEVFGVDRAPGGSS